MAQDRVKLRIITTVAKARGLRVADVEATVEAFLEELRAQTLARGRLVWPQFASFEVRQRKARRIRTPDGSAVCALPARRVVAVRPTRNWRNHPGARLPKR